MRIEKNGDMNIVLHDYFESAEGGGRLALLLADTIGADLSYGFKVPRHPYFHDKSFSGKERPLIPFTRVPIWRQFCLALAFKGKTQFLKEYDTAVYSGFYTPLAAHNHTGKKNIYYCHTPPRFLYDQHDFYLSLIPAWQRPVLHAFNRYFKPRYEEAVRKMDVVVTNSENVRQRIKQYLGIDAVVVYPPCDTDTFKWQGQSDYYLSMARLDPLKRVDRVVKAFLGMPEKKLVVVSSGPELTRLKKLAGDAANISIKGRVSDTALVELLGHSIATIYIPKDEDFGMSPVESMAAGKPVLGVAEGGVLESVIDGETGILLSPDPAPEDIVGAVELLTPDKARGLRNACEKRAQLFRQEVFVEQMKKIIGDG